MLRNAFSYSAILCSNINKSNNYSLLICYLSVLQKLLHILRPWEAMKTKQGQETATFLHVGLLTSESTSTQWRLYSSRVGDNETPHCRLQLEFQHNAHLVWSIFENIFPRVMKLQNCYIIKRLVCLQCLKLCNPL